jgi:hypothetical protein
MDYSTVEGTENILKEVNDRMGLDRLRCLHLNDSKIELGGNRDRHANIGEGTIGSKGLAPLVGHPKIRDLPLLLEVPGTGDGPRAEDVAQARKVVTAGIKLYGASATISATKKPTPTKATPTKATATKKSATKATPTKKTATKKTASTIVIAKKSARKK